VVILFEFIVFVGGMYFVLRYFSKLKSQITQDKIDIQEKIIEKKTKNPDHIYSTTQRDEPVRKSGGNYVPYGLTESEKTILEMFYDN
jgi:hypothetical protein